MKNAIRIDLLLKVNPDSIRELVLIIANKSRRDHKTQPKQKWRALFGEKVFSFEII